MQKDISKLAAVIALEEEQLFKDARQVVTALAGLPEVRRGDVAACNELLPKLMEQHTRYANLALVDANGNMLASAMPIRGTVNVADRDYFRRVLETRRFSVGESQGGRLAGKHTINVGYPVLDSNGQVKCVVFAAIDLNALHHIEEEIETQLPKAATLTKIDRSGVVLWRYPDSDKWVGQRKADSVLVKTVLVHKKGVEEVVGLDGVERMYSFAPIKSEWGREDEYVMVGMPRAAMFAEADRLFSTNLLTLSLVTLLALLAIWIGTDFFVLRQLHALVGATKRLAAGDLSARSGLRHGFGELSQLAQAFDQMSGALSEREEERQKAENALRASEEVNHHILEAVPGGIALVGADGAILNTNQEAQSFFGLSHVDFRKMRVADFDAWTIWEDGSHCPAEDHPVTKCLRTGQPQPRATIGVRRPDGEVRWGIFTAVPCADPGNKNEMGTVVTFLDITERRKTEQALRENEERFRSLSSSSPLGIFLTDNEGKCVYTNPRYREIHGLTLMESLGDGWMRVIHRDDMGNLSQQWKAFMQDGRPFSVECRIVRSDQKTIWVHSRAARMLSDDGKSIGYVGTVEDITDRKQSEVALRQSEERYRSLIETAQDVIFTLSADGSITSLNSAFESATGWTRDEWVSKPFVPIVHMDDMERSIDMYSRVLRGERVPVFELRILTRSEKYLIMQFTATPQLQNGQAVGVLGIARDITERKKLEEQFLQAQKMEAIGHLAGGVAHDFNNILTAIMGYSDLMLRRMRKDDPLRPNAEEIRKSVERAASLTRQLLAFSRKQALQPRVFDLNFVVTDMEKMLHRLIGETIRLNTVADPALGRAKADPGQIEQVIMNLCVNARDAMPKGGTLTIATSNVTFRENGQRYHDGVGPGEYVLLSITDTGMGMTDEVKTRLFEPFFTTKEQGKGTGLGLATVYGIVKQSGGHVALDSELGKGTTFRVYLPRVQEAAEASHQRTETGEMPVGSETVLVVEDEETLRTLAVSVLGELGYHVREATDGEHALQLVAQNNGSPIHLLVSDLIMPRVGGQELAEQLRRINPTLKVMFTSGYMESIVRESVSLTPSDTLLEKPFTPSMLARRVREVLDA